MCYRTRQGSSKSENILPKAKCYFDKQFTCIPKKLSSAPEPQKRKPEKLNFNKTLCKKHTFL